MKKLGAYISPRADTEFSSPYFTKGCFVYYEYSPPRIAIWRLDANLNQIPDEIILIKSPDELKKHIEPHETWANHYISYRDRTYHIRNIECRYQGDPAIEIIDELTVDSDSIDTYETWRHTDSSAYRFLKEAKLTDFVYKRPEFHVFNNLKITDELTGDQYKTWTSSIDNTIKEELKKSLEKSALNSYYGMGGFTTRPVLSAEEIGKMFDSKNKETKTMEKKKMTETDSFLKDLNGITITSTYSKLDHGFGKPYYIYYPEMEITEDIADTLLTVLLMAKKDYFHKIVFNPEKGTTTIHKMFGDPVTVRCKDAKFDYILGYYMARSKMYLGSDDYNWFNKIKNHRKTHIEYTKNPTEPKAKRTSKKGGKK